MRLKAMLACAAALLSIGASAQFIDGSEAPAEPWAGFKLNPATKIKLDFRNSNVDMVLSLYQKTSGVTIVKDPTLTGPITVTSAKPVGLKEAFQILNTVLGLKGFDLKKEGTLLVIRAKPARGQGRPGGIQIPPNFQMPSADGPPVELRVYPIRFASASTIARVVNDVFTQAANMGQPGGMQMPPGVQLPGGMQITRPGGAQQRQSNVRASSDDFSNSVIINAPSKEHGQIKELIDQIDKQTEQPQRTQVFKLEYSQADQLVSVVQNVLNSNAPRGRGNAPSNVPIEQRFQQAFRGGGAAAFGQVVADPRTNSLVVTATEENLATVAQVIKTIDQPVEMMSSTIVVPLANARADLVADLINQAYGGRTGGGNNAGANRNNNNRTNNNQNRFGGGGGGGGNRNNAPAGRSADAGQDPNALALDLQDPDAESGELRSQVFFSPFGGGFGGGGFGQQNNQNRNNQSQFGRDQSGRLVPINNLNGQITAIPDINTNSIIIVATPENAQLLQQIIDQLDRIPEQVMIETIIVEATLDASTKLGVEWKLATPKPFNNTGTGQASSNFGIGTSAALQGFKYTLSSGNLDAVLNALQTDQRYEVLSTPRIFTSNNVEAEINISQRIPYVISQRTDANGNITFDYSFQDVGIILTVTPRITTNGFVTMDISQTANDLQGFTSFNAPIINQRQAQTTVSVLDGETIILGGIIRSTVTSTVKKIPLLGDIPILGNLFKSTDRTKSKTELLVFLTPRVVRSPDEARELRQNTEKQIGKKLQDILNGSKPKENSPATKTENKTTKGGGN